MAAQSGWDNVTIDGVTKLRSLDVTVENTRDIPADRRQEPVLLHDTASKNEPLRRQGIDERAEGHGEVLRFQLPSRMSRRQALRRTTPTLRQRRPGSQSFETVFMKGADTGKRITV